MLWPCLSTWWFPFCILLCFHDRLSVHGIAWEHLAVVNAQARLRPPLTLTEILAAKSPHRAPNPSHQIRQALRARVLVGHEFFYCLRIHHPPLPSSTPHDPPLLTLHLRQPQTLHQILHLIHEQNRENENYGLGVYECMP